MDNYVPLHSHTHYSNGRFHDSINAPDDVIQRIYELGQPAFAVTDHGTCSGLMDVYSTLKKFNKKHNSNIKMILGTELYFTSDVLIRQDDLSHIIFLAKNDIGKENLNALMTQAHGNKGKNPENFYKFPRVDIDLIRRYSQGLYCGTACMGGILKRSDAEEVLLQLKDIFKDNLFIELHTVQEECQREFNMKALELGQKHNIKFIVANDAHYPTKDHYQLHRQFRGAKDTKGEDTGDGYYATNDYYFHSSDECRQKLSYLPKDIVDNAIDYTVEITNNCNVDIEYGQKHYPICNYGEPIKELKRQCRDGWNSKIKGKVENAKVYQERYLKELDVLIKQDYPSYFLITSDLYKFGRENSYAMGPGRGSVVGCLIAYLMGITQLDPIKYNLIFERFAHMERIAPPDIDNDLSRRYRHKFVEFVQSQYGEVYQCRTFSVLGAKGALRKACKALGYLKADEDDLVKLIEKYESDDDEEVSSYEQKVWMLDNIKNESNEEAVELAKRMLGLIFGFSKHASALIVLSEDITKFCSVERQTDSKTHEVNYVAACNFKYLEEMGLMKLDMLGLKTLDVVQDTLNYIGGSIDIQDIPLNDANTSKKLTAGEINACFQISSPGMTSIVKRIKPEAFVDLIPLVALYRPGPKNAIVPETGNTMVETYLRVRNGDIEPQYLHPKLEPILSDTYSIILYQEQILEIAKELCGYSLGEADILRRIIGKKKLDEMKPAVEQMIERGVSNGIPKDTMEKITHQIVEFAAYCFNKGHSAGYGYLSYQTSYLKAHYPLEFMCASLNNEDGQQKDFIPLINEVKRLGFTILPPDITKKNREWVIENGELRIGLQYIRDVGKKLCVDHTDTFEDVIGNNPKDISTALVKSGACDSFGGERVDLLKQATGIISEKQRLSNAILKDTQRLAELQQEAQSTSKKLKKYQTIITQIENRKCSIRKNQEKLVELRKLEKTFDLYDEAKGECEVLSFSFKELPKVKLGKLTNISKIKDRNKHDMAFLTMKSDYGEYQCTVFANGWELIADKVIVGESYKFVVGDSGILEELKVNGEVIKLNERKFWKKR